MLLPSSLLVVWFLALRVTGSCECGYQTKTGEVWQYAINTDFSQISNSQFERSSDWTIDTTLHQSSSSAPYAIRYTTQNVAVKNAELQLTCSAYNSSSEAMTINAAEISTSRSDILYGSFRARYKVDGGSGAVAALFFYASDTQEADIELLTRNPTNEVDFTNQPGSTTTYVMPKGDVRTSYVDYRFDWLDSSTLFYVGSKSAANLTTDVPNINGTIKLNSWANGGSYSGSIVPTKDSVMSVQTIDLYFNTSDASLALSWKQKCATANTQPCAVGGTSSSSTTSSNISSATQNSAASRPRAFRP